MLLLIGPAYQGKLAYLRGTLGVPEEEIFYCSRESARLDLSKRAICGLHLWVRAMLEQGVPPAELLCREEIAAFRGKILLCDDIGGGIVPVDRMDRLWREAVGRTLRLLTPEADAVLDFTCGIPRALKGELPR